MSGTFVDRLLYATPFWLIAVTIFVGMAASAWTGHYLRKRREYGGAARRKDKDEDSKEGLVVSSVMGLLALLIGFTFSLAIDRFDTRRERVLMEANAVGTTYLRTQLLEEPHRSRISGLLVRYADLSLALSQATPGPEQQLLLAKNDALITDLWSATVAAFPSMKGYDFSSTYLESMNEVIDLNAARQQARRARVPSEILLVLCLYQFIAAGVIGYVLIGRGGQRTGTLLLLLFGLSLVLVIDVDYPVGGGINVSQEPMRQLKASLKSWRPGTFDRFSPGAAAPAPVPSPKR